MDPDKIHNGVRCDSCDCSPIFGSRYKCNVCVNYDLCSDCFHDGQHFPHHHSFTRFKYDVNIFTDGGTEQPARKQKKRHRKGPRTVEGDHGRGSVGVKHMCIIFGADGTRQSWTTTINVFRGGDPEGVQLEHDIASTRGNYHERHLPFLDSDPDRDSNSDPDPDSYSDSDPDPDSNPSGSAADMERIQRNMDPQVIEELILTLGETGLNRDSSGASTSRDPGRQPTAVSSTIPRSSSYETLREQTTCGICLEARKDMAFQCGHSACVSCASIIQKCHICRQNITGRIKLFP